MPAPAAAASLSGVPLRVVRVRALAAGNGLGRRPGAAILVAAPAPADCDADAVAAFLGTIAPDIEDEFRLARIAGRAPPLIRAFAAVVVALTAEGRDLAAWVGADPGGRTGRWLVLVEDGVSIAAQGVLSLATTLLLWALAGPPADAALAAEVERTCGTLVDRFLRVERAVLARVIEARGHVWRATPPTTIGALGEGRRRVRLRHAVTSRTAAPAALLAERKDVTATLLARFGLPVPRQVVVTAAAAALDAAGTIGFPVVVKPVGASNARGVAVGLATPAAVEAAFHAATRYGREIVVESLLPGEHFRLMVLAGRLVAAVHSVPARFVGDGRRSLREMVDEANRIPRRQRPRPLQRSIAWTDEILEYLAARGQGPDWVPPPGTAVELHWSGHGGRGGSALAVAGPIHPDNAQAACQAARIVGLDVAGIDMLLPDVSRSWRETGGGICEVNRAPGLRYHVVADGPDTPVPGLYVDHLADRPGRIPILVFVGGAELADTALAAAALLEGHGLAVGVAVGGRFAAGGLPLADPGEDRPQRLERLVDDPTVGAIVALVTPAALRDAGLGHGRVDLACVADPPDPLAVCILRGLGAATLPPSAVADGRLRQWIASRRAAWGGEAAR